MKYWWVNQNQTHRHEISGRYMWSPKTRKDGVRNRFYENMTKVEPGDIVFSFINTQIPYLGIIMSKAYEHPKPNFGTVGNAWDENGWRVDVDYTELRTKIRPRDFIQNLIPLLPNQYSPIGSNGNGRQNVYLAEIPEALAHKLFELIGDESNIFTKAKGPDINKKLEDKILENIKNDPSIAETEKEALTKARIGQGKFRDDVIKVHKQCPITRINNPALLKASHIKPWAKCENNNERLDPLNGIPLTPDADHLFELGFLSFNDAGKAIFSSQLDPEVFLALGINMTKEYGIIIYHQRQLDYLGYHREQKFKK